VHTIRGFVEAVGLAAGSAAGFAAFGSSSDLAAGAVGAIAGFAIAASSLICI